MNETEHHILSLDDRHIADSSFVFEALKGPVATFIRTTISVTGSSTFQRTATMLRSGVLHGLMCLGHGGHGETRQRQNLTIQLVDHEAWDQTKMGAPHVPGSNVTGDADDREPTRASEDVVAWTWCQR